MAKEFTEDDDALLAELGVEVEAKKIATRTPLEERIIAGFEEIQRFFEEHGRAPQHGETRDIFERLYAVRLDRIRTQPVSHALVAAMDYQGLLSGQPSPAEGEMDDLDDDALLAELGVKAETPSITELKHVRSAVDKRAAEEIASRDRCEDFETFKPIFEKVQIELNTGLRETRPFERKAEIEPGRFFIVGGQKAYVAEMGKGSRTTKGT